LLALLLITAVCFVAIKAGLAHASPLLFAALRLLLGGAGLWLLLPLLGLPLLPPRRHWPWLIGLALSASAFAYGAMFVSPAFTGAGIASVLGNTQPLLLVGLGVWFLGERLSLVKVWALVLGLTGVTLIAAPALAAPRAFAWEGAVLALASALGLAVGSLLVKRLRPGPYLLTLSAWQLLLGSLPLFAGSLLWQQGSLHLSPGFTFWLLFLALAGTAFVTAGWYWLIQEGDLGQLSNYLFLVPVFGLALAVLFLGERFTLLQGVGLALVLVGIGVVMRGEKTSPARKGSL
jgi:O-acetylserine/cysteine efflux transporter